ncbi:hypothetical protein LguiB_028135 [Lonicera macranthoides]
MVDYDGSKSTSTDSRKGKGVGQSNKPPMPNSQKRRKSREKSERKKRSWVWEHFTTETKPLIKKEDELEQEEREQREKMEKQKEKDVMEKKSPAVARVKGHEMQTCRRMDSSRIVKASPRAIYTHLGWHMYLSWSEISSKEVLRERRNPLNGISGRHKCTDNEFYGWVEHTLLKDNNFMRKATIT